MSGGSSFSDQISIIESGRLPMIELSILGIGSSNVPPYHTLSGVCCLDIMWSKVKFPDPEKPAPTNSIFMNLRFYFGS